MFKPNQKHTIYGEWVESGVGEYLTNVKNAFTLYEFANHYGIRITHNLRKRIKSLVMSGKLDCYYALSGGKGSVLVYSRPASELTSTGEPF